MRQSSIWLALHHKYIRLRIVKFGAGCVPEITHHLNALPLADEQEILVVRL
jgi:hypothetical protein